MGMGPLALYNSHEEKKKKKKMPREVSYIWARHANEEEIEVLTNKLIFASYPPHDNTSLIK